MKYKVHPKYEGEAFWKSPASPEGYTRMRSCENCGKGEVVSTYPYTKLICNEVTEYQGVHEDTGNPYGYSRQPFETSKTMTCGEHKFLYEMEEANTDD
jgi:hypothetical protein